MFISDVAVALGLAGGALVFRLARFLYAQAAETELVMADLVARDARVTIAIPENGVGEVSLLVGAEQTSQLARSVDGTPIPSGRDVVVRAVHEGQVYVEVNR